VEAPPSTFTLLEKAQPGVAADLWRAFDKPPQPLGMDAKSRAELRALEWTLPAAADAFELAFAGWLGVLSESMGRTGRLRCFLSQFYATAAKTLRACSM
jgi:hypothetical protein